MVSVTKEPNTFAHFFFKLRGRITRELSVKFDLMQDIRIGGEFKRGRVKRGGGRRTGVSVGP